MDLTRIRIGRTLEEMGKLRTSLHVALALLFVSLTCDPGAACALAGMAGSCTEGAPETGAGGGLSGVAMLPGTFEAGSTAVKGERLAAALLDSEPVGAGCGLSPAAVLPAPLGELAAPTPLYLSHCAFLC